MATGASTADLAIILIDARKGVLPQSRRHAYIASLLGIAPHRRRRQQDGPGGLLERGLSGAGARLAAAGAQAGHFAGLISIPVSALDGDNVVDRGAEHAVV